METETLPSPPAAVDMYEEMGYAQETWELREIYLDERARKDYGDIEGLADSFDVIGLGHPLLVKRFTDADREKHGAHYKGKLLGGGRRYYALLLKKKPRVMVRIYPETISPDTELLVEKIENVFRKNFEWQEQVKLEEHIHALQVARHGLKTSTTPGAPGWSKKKTAELLGTSPTTVTEDLKLASLLEIMPELAKQKTKKDAKKVLKQVAKAADNKALVAKLLAVESNTGIDEKRRTIADSYHLGDCIAGMKSLPDASFDWAEIDPPYAIELDENRESANSSQTAIFYNEIPRDEYTAFMREVLTETYRVLKPNSWTFLWFASDPWFQPMADLIREAGFSLRAIPGIWYKPTGPKQCTRPERYLARSYEMFFYAAKGSPEIQEQGKDEVFSFPAPHESHRCHPTERPIALTQSILQRFTKQGTRGIVPFGGSGSTLLAASNRLSSAVAFDLTPQYKDAFTLRVFEGEPGNYKDRSTK